MPYKWFKDSIMKNKKITVLTIFLLSSIIYMATFITPKIYITTKIQSVTDKDYDIFVRYSKVPVEKKTRDNCRLISIHMKVVKPALLIKNIKIERVTLKEYLDETLYFSNVSNGFEHLGSYISNGNNESFDGIDVYMDGMTDEKLKDFFKDYKIEVAWSNVLTGQNKKIYYLKDYFQ
jgi:hypothetical protein